MSIAPIEPIDQPKLPRATPTAAPVARPGSAGRAGRRRGRGRARRSDRPALVLAGPKVELVQTAYGPYPIDGEPEGYFADDGWFMIIGLVAGIAIAVAAWLLVPPPPRPHRPDRPRHRLRGRLRDRRLARQQDRLCALPRPGRERPVDTHIFRPAKVRAGEAGLLYGFIPWVRGSLLIQAVVVAAIYTGLAGFHASPSLTHDPDLNSPAPDYAYRPAYDGPGYDGPAHSDHPAYDGLAHAGHPALDGRSGYDGSAYNVPRARSATTASRTTATQPLMVAPAMTAPRTTVSRVRPA